MVDLEEISLCKKKIIWTFQTFSFDFADSNEINSLNGRAFENLKNLKKVLLHDNACINEDFEESQISALKRTLDNICAFEEIGLTSGYVEISSIQTTEITTTTSAAKTEAAKAMQSVNTETTTVMQAAQTEATAVKSAAKPEKPKDFLTISAVVCAVIFCFLVAAASILYKQIFCKQKSNKTQQSE